MNEQFSTFARPIGRLDDHSFAEWDTLLAENNRINSPRPGRMAAYCMATSPPPAPVSTDNPTDPPTAAQLAHFNAAVRNRTIRVHAPGSASHLSDEAEPMNLAAPVTPDPLFRVSRIGGSVKTFAQAKR